MPPKQQRQRPAKAAPPAAVAATPAAPAPIEAIGLLFQQVHRSAAHAQKCKKEIITMSVDDEAGVLNAVCGVVLLVLKQAPQLTNDALKRHYAFLTEVCRAFREQCSSDELPVAVMKQLFAYHNANDKLVRLCVVTTYEALLKTVDQGNTSEERQDFYQDAAEMLKQRVHDRCPLVRERAVAAVAAFQTGKKSCDVSQQLIALLCTDTNADVRRQILRSIAPRKEFLEGYFHGMIRCVRDVVARVRADAWDALGRFPWRYITAYASAKAIKLPELIANGLTDTNSSVVIACRAALTNCWLHRDCRDECETLLDGIACGYVLPSLGPFEQISGEILTYTQKRSPQKHFGLNLEDVNTSSLFMWKADCKVVSERECDVEEETELLLPLEKFAAVLQDTVYAYARPDAPPKAVKFRNIEDADNMLRLLLSVFAIYEDNGYLAHADNTTRISLLRLLNFLLKVVPDDDPALFVDVAVRSLKSLTRRTPEEATKTITSALDSLFRSLKLPQRYALGFEDIEALGRKSRERQQELARRIALLRSGEVSQDEVDDLKSEMDRDEKFMLRMQLIVLAFLSHSERGDAIPTFCSHIIQLGRQQDHEKVKVTATQSLGLQCLVSAETVHTFMPLILADAQEHVFTASSAVDEGMTVPVAAIGVIYDLVMEYGFKFFDINSTPSGAASARPSVSAAAAAATTTVADEGLGARLQLEQELAEEDVHKVGSRNLLNTLLSFLSPDNGSKNAVSIAGLCKLLSCNRIPSESVPKVVSQLCCHFARLLQLKKDAHTPLTRYLKEYMDKFFRGYTASHPKRQAFVAEGGVAAFLAMLRLNTAVASRLMDYVTRTTDAFVLTQIREIDPEAARRVSNNSANELEALQDSEAAAGSASRTAAARASMQSGRLLRELSRYSLHERIAEAILVALSTTADTATVEQQQTCLDVLEKRMYFYNKDPQPFVFFCGQRALAALETAAVEAGEGRAVRERLSAWLSELERRYGNGAVAATSPTGDEAAALQDRFTALSTEHETLYRHLVGNGMLLLDDIPPQPNRTTTTTSASGGMKVKDEDDAPRSAADRKRERMDSIFADIGAGMPPRRKMRR